MRATISGASGFIGSHLTHELLRLGWDVSIITRYGNVAKCPRLADVWDRITVFEADLRNRDALRAARKFEPDVLFHLAAYNHVGTSWGQVEECFDVNAKGTANILDALAHPRLRTVYVSSSEVYGLQDRVPWEEVMTPHPQSPYGVTKYAGELYAHMRRRAGDDIVVVRPFNCYGPGQSTKAVIPDLIRQALSGRLKTTRGEQTREFNFVSDIVSGIILAGEKQIQVEGPINLCCGEETSIEQLTRWIIEEVDSRGLEWDVSVPYRPNEIWRMCADNSKAKILLGWHPKVSLREGIIETVKWIKSSQRS